MVNGVDYDILVGEFELFKYMHVYVYLVGLGLMEYQYVPLHRTDGCNNTRHRRLRRHGIQMKVCAGEVPIDICTTTWSNVSNVSMSVKLHLKCRSDLVITSQ